MMDLVICLSACVMIVGSIVVLVAISKHDAMVCRGVCEQGRRQCECDSELRKVI
jgi:hypothetical protein